MSDDFGTINVSRGERAREIAGMREHFRRHREAIEELIADAPSERFAQLYSRLVDEIDVSLTKLDELDGVASAPQPREFSTEPGMRPLVTPPQHDFGGAPEMKPGASASRVVLIVLVAMIGLAAIGWLMWRASNRGDAATGTLETTATAPSAETTLPATTAPEPSAGELTVAPASQDFGVIRKGTRAVRTFTLRNETEAPLSIKASRSVCRCLYYQHPPVIPPKSEKTLSVTIDGAKAKAGDLRETVQVTTSDPSVKTSADVIATIR